MFQDLTNGGTCPEKAGNRPSQSRILQLQSLYQLAFAPFPGSGYREALRDDFQKGRLYRSVTFVSQAAVFFFRMNSIS